MREYLSVERTECSAGPWASLTFTGSIVGAMIFDFEAPLLIFLISGDLRLRLDFVAVIGDDASSSRITGVCWFSCCVEKD